MAGHSHWANIVRKKSAVDKKRGKLFGKLSRAIMVAARNGGGDPAMNLPLRYAIDKARQASMPKDSIEKAVKKGTGELEGENLEEILYEGYGPGGVAIMVNTLTDKRTRTVDDLRNIFKKNGGEMGKAGCVAYLFNFTGFFGIPAEGIDEEELLDVVIEAGAGDMKRQGDTFEITCEPSAFNDVQAALEEHNITVDISETTYLPVTQVEVDEDNAPKVMRLLELLDDNDDVQSVYSNANFSDELMEQLAKEG